MRRLSEDDLIEALDLLLRRRGEIPREGVGRLRWKFGIVGDPIFQFAGFPKDGDGRIYLDWDFEVLDNVAVLPRGRR
jgi:hypothetical protein